MPSPPTPLPLRWERGAQFPSRPEGTRAAGEGWPLGRGEGLLSTASPSPGDYMAAVIPLVLPSVSLCLCGSFRPLPPISAILVKSITYGRGVGVTGLGYLFLECTTVLL